MDIVVKKKHPVTHSIKVAIATLAVFAVVGLLARWTKTSDEEAQPQSLDELLTANSSILLPSIPLDVPAGSNESAWSTAFADAIGGRTEVKVDFFCADVLTSRYAVEVDFYLSGKRVWAKLFTTRM